MISDSQVARDLVNTGDWLRAHECIISIPRIPGMLVRLPSAGFSFQVY